MRRSIHVSAAARIDLLEIWIYLAERASSDVADATAASLELGLNKLGENPGIGHLRDDLTSLPVKFYTVGRYLIVFELREHSIEIVRIIHGSRDISAILQDE